MKPEVPITDELKACPICGGDCVHPGNPDNWRPIAEAPKNENILIAEHDKEYGWILYVCCWSESRKAWIEFWCEEYARFNPSHWQPLPTPPEGE